MRLFSNFMICLSLSLLLVGCDDGDEPIYIGTNGFAIDGGEYCHLSVETNVYSASSEIREGRDFGLLEISMRKGLDRESDGVTIISVTEGGLETVGTRAWNFTESGIGTHFVEVKIGGKSYRSTRGLTHVSTDGSTEFFRVGERIVGNFRGEVEDYDGNSIRIAGRFDLAVPD